MAEIIWTEPTLNTLDEIADYIALSNLPAAQKLVTTVFENVDRLEDHPRSGRRVAELPNLDYREVIVNPCRVIYKYTENKAFILHVMRQEQQLKRYALGEP